MAARGGDGDEGEGFDLETGMNQNRGEVRRSMEKKGNANMYNSGAGSCLEWHANMPWIVRWDASR